MRRYRVCLDISGPRLAAYYRGSAHWVLATSDCGVTVQFRADHLRRFVGRDGVHGRFELAVDRQQRLVRIERIG